MGKVGRDMHGCGVKTVIITCGAKGSYISSGGNTVSIPAAKVTVVDTTGTGDSYLGGFLYKYIKVGLPETLSKEQLTEFGTFAGRVSSYCVGRRGAIPAMPSLADVRIN